jgi:GntR family transcriptional regulator, transcriptional repressor for pyruvate dehydrogenase complex
MSLDPCDVMCLIPGVKSRTPTAIESAAARLRAISLAAGDGALLGSEEALVAKLGASRSTVRQVARLLEREGLLRVRRGINGGYFAARPDLQTIEEAVSAYLTAIAVAPEDVTAMSSILWVEVMRKAARLRSQHARQVAAVFGEKIRLVAPDAPFEDVLALEQESRQAIFSLTGSGYIELIFQINMVHAQNNFGQRRQSDDSHAHRDFVHAWRNAKMLELAAITDGDEQLAMMAARHFRNVWDGRIWDQRTRDTSLETGVS